MDKAWDKERDISRPFHFALATILAKKASILWARAHGKRNSAPSLNYWKGSKG